MWERSLVELVSVYFEYITKYAEPVVVIRNAVVKLETFELGLSVTNYITFL